jgi:hypothetical protein
MFQNIFYLLLFNSFFDLKCFYLHVLLLFHINLDFADLLIGYINKDSLNFCNIVENVNYFQQQAIFVPMENLHL